MAFLRLVKYEYCLLRGYLYYMLADKETSFDAKSSIPNQAMLLA